METIQLSEEWEDGFKVVLYDPQAIKHPTSSNERGVFRVEYPFNKQAGRPQGCGPLAVFPKRKDAEAFMQGKSDVEIFRCKYRPSTERKLYTPDRPNSCPPGRSFTTRRSNLIMMLEFLCPAGTDFADQVILLP